MQSNKAQSALEVQNCECTTHTCRRFGTDSDEPSLMGLIRKWSRWNVNMIVVWWLWRHRFCLRTFFLWYKEDESNINLPLMRWTIVSWILLEQFQLFRFSVFVQSILSQKTTRCMKSLKFWILFRIANHFKIYMRFTCSFAKIDNMHIGMLKRHYK